MNPFEIYLKELLEIRSSGVAVKETSYYGPLATLLNDIGKTLEPKVKYIINLQNQGTGLPDGGLHPGPIPEIPLAMVMLCQILSLGWTVDLIRWE